MVGLTGKYVFVSAEPRYCTQTEMLVGVVKHDSGRLYAVEWDGVGVEPVQGPDDCRLLAYCSGCDNDLPKVQYYFSKARRLDNECDFCEEARLEAAYKRHRQDTEVR